MMPTSADHVSTTTLHDHGTVWTTPTTTALVFVFR
ncbi:hypothetical protein BKA16_003489 [Gordonia humi]|uniref:Uncharacterized protein n=1 Tax=Gordonia humi TaxID=686429 RepID=A0A840FBQ7_9ACTN|nr:hypothetical protein [Gordonia humi]